MSTFSYNTGVPAANNNPSVDQSDMLTNTSSINSILGVDHVTFNASGGGRHNQVTFNSNNVPSLPASLLTLFSNNQDGNGNNLPNGLSQLFAFSGTAAQSQLQYYIKYASSSDAPSPYGSVMLFGGLIIKFGFVPTVTTAGITINLATSPATPFPSACFGVVASQWTSGSAGTIIGAVGTASTIRLVASTGSVSAFYIAIGI